MSPQPLKCFKVDWTITWTDGSVDHGVDITTIPSLRGQAAFEVLTRTMGDTLLPPAKSLDVEPLEIVLNISEGIVEDGRCIFIPVEEPHAF